jgi:hypothetical protein
MKLHIFFLLAVLTIVPAVMGKSASDAASYFPEESDLGIQLPVSTNVEFENSAKLSEIADGKLVSDVGFSKYFGRTYTARNSSLTIEVFELLDSSAAYSLVTLLRKTSFQSGPPGDFLSKISDSICFAQGRRFVRIRTQDLPETILEKAATTVSKRLGSEHGELPSLISHLPKSGYDSSSLHYFPAIAAYKNYVKGKSAAYILTPSDMEIAQARYFVDSRSGIITLLKLPTPELAEEYYSELSLPPSSQSEGLSVYAKRAGPLIALLEGNFDPQSADKLLKSVQFSYSVRWVDDKVNNTKVIWGIPLGVLGAVVNSLFFVAILCVASILFGAIVAIVRFSLKTFFDKRSPNDENENNISQLRLR